MRDFTVNGVVLGVPRHQHASVIDGQPRRHVHQGEPQLRRAIADRVRLVGHLGRDKLQASVAALFASNRRL